jgi:uncharacterized protein YggE
MRKYLLWMGVVSLCPALFAQLDSNSVTVTASRSTALQPDQVVFSVFVESNLSASFEDVLSALAGSGITQANFTGINAGAPQFVTGNGPPTPVIDWAFALSAPLSKIKDTVTMLNALQQSVAKMNKGLRLSFTVQGTQVSQQAQQAQPCSIPDLLADARAQAQKLTNAGGFTLDTILAMASATATASSQVVGLTSIVLPSSVPCTLTVKFGLLRFQ